MQNLSFHLQNDTTSTFFKSNHLCIPLLMVSIVLLDIKMENFEKEKAPEMAFTPSLKPCLLLELGCGAIYLDVSRYTFVYFVAHIHHILQFSKPRSKFLEPKWSHYNKYPIICQIVQFHLRSQILSKIKTKLFVTFTCFIFLQSRINSL